MRTCLISLGSDGQSGENVSGDLVEAEGQRIGPMSVTEQSKFRMLVSLAGTLQNAASIALSSMSVSTLSLEIICGSLCEIENEAGIVRASALGSMEALIEGSPCNISQAQTLSRRMSEKAIQDVQKLIRKTGIEGHARGPVDAGHHQGAGPISLSAPHGFGAGNRVYTDRHNYVHQNGTGELPNSAQSSQQIELPVHIDPSIVPSVTNYHPSSNRSTSGAVTSRLIEVLEVMGAKAGEEMPSREALLQILHSRALELAGIVSQAESRVRSKDPEKDLFPSDSGPPSKFDSLGCYV
jgi:hypothetical protein